MALSVDDWNRLDRKFEALHAEIKEQGSKVYKMEGKLAVLESGSPHKCAEEIQKHEAGAWTHNPRKAVGLLATIATVWEGIRAFFHK